MEMQFEDLNVEEVEGSIDVCVEVVEGTITANVRVDLISMDDSTTGNENSDSYCKVLYSHF